jgi:hypothetical protein
MSDVERHRIALRMSTLLQRELGEGVDAKRMVNQPLYARDVLLVCEALRGTEGPVLAHEYRSVEQRPMNGSASTPRTMADGVPLDSGSADNPTTEPGDSTSSGWMSSLWPATMRGGLFKRGAKPPRRIR